MDFDKEKVKQWLDTYWTSPRNCSICGEDNWLLLDKVWHLGEVPPRPPILDAWIMEAQIPPPSTLPVVALMCNVCGHTVFFNAFAVKALEKPAPQGGER